MYLEIKSFNFKSEPVNAPLHYCVLCYIYISSDSPGSTLLPTSSIFPFYLRSHHMLYVTETFT